MFDGADDEPIDTPMFDDMLPIELNAEPILALPLIDDGLYVATGWNGLRDCVTGSGLKSTRDESAKITRKLAFSSMKSNAIVMRRSRLRIFTCVYYWELEASWIANPLS